MGRIEKLRDGRGRASTHSDAQPLVRFAGGAADDHTIEVMAGEIIGFAGLDGHGQRERLRAMFAACERDTDSTGSAPAFVAGDRLTEGVFALWSIADNLTARSLTKLARRGVVSIEALRSMAAEWFARLGIKAPSIDTPILSLSGGNQQKVLFARALASDARIVFLDDPMRGVDVGTKQEVYRLLSLEAEKGRGFVWYTTELEELENCARIYVFREGRAVVKLEGADISQTRILQASFGGAHG
jgi:ribose transport system ATP-binding protein